MDEILTENEPKGCMFFERGNVEPEKGHRIRHEYCQHPDMRAINKVPPDKKLFCMGSKCGCAVSSDGSAE